MAKYKVKSDYTLLKKRSQLIPGGTVYENNYVTISPMDDLFSPGQYITNTDSNFRFSVNTSYNAQKRHTRNGWVKPDTCITDDKNCEYWTMDNLGEGPISEESEIRIKPDYTSLRDFAYYGSAVEMVRATINNVILNFPAELYFSGEEFTTLNDEGTEYISTDINGKTRYLIPNGYGINVDLPYVNENSVYNPLRYLCLSKDNYDLYKDGNFVSSGVTFDVEQQNWTCDKNINGDIFAIATINSGSSNPLTIYVYKKGEEKVLYYTNDSLKGYSIRPCDAEVNHFYHTLDDFGNVLLDRSTNPKYMSVFETPYEMDMGNVYRMESYVWPSENDWNPKVDGAGYERYISRLIELAEFSDLYDSNIIWRMMTHEAIKNLDWTFTRSDGEDTGDYSVIDSTRVEAMMQIWGRNFDGLKRYIDNIKNSNKVTYDERNNVPDYELSDFVDLSGWDTFVIKPKARTDVLSEPIYPNRSKGFSEVDMNTTFMRVMKLNSSYINSMKGTVKGIETMFGILGLKDDEYEISEYVTVAYGNDDNCLIDTSYAEHIGMEQNYETGNVKYPAYSTIAAINSYINVPAYSDGGENGDWLDGIAVKPVVSRDEKSIYVVPWYDINKRYAGNWWYQCYGGWGKRTIKNVVNPFSVSGNTIELSNVYDETESSLLFFNTIDEMLSIPPSSVYKGMVSYVTNLNDISRYNGEISDNGDYSHYFILKDISKFGVFGEDGWRYIPKSELVSGNSNDAKKVIFLETIKETTDGNNPHCSKGKYDDGKEYLDCMNQIFKNADDDNLQTFTDNDKDRIFDITFNIGEKLIDNSKSYYFPDENTWEKTSLYHAIETIGEWSEISGVTTNDLNSICKYSKSPENDREDYEEPAANSIVNVKNVKVEFKYPEKLPSGTEKEWREYIEDIVMEYVKQMIPSTTIFEYGFVGDKVLESLSFIIKSAPTIPPGGGTVTINDCDYEVIARYNNNTTEDVTDYAVIEKGTGTTSVSADSNFDGEIVGEINCYATYGGMNSPYASIEIRKERKVETGRTVTSVSVTPVKYTDVGSGGTINLECTSSATVNLTLRIDYNDGTTESIPQNNYNGSGITWNITSNDTDFRLSSNSINNPKLTVDANPNESERSAIITTNVTVNGVGDSATSVVKQFAKHVEPEPEPELKTPKIIKIEYSIE